MISLGAPKMARKTNHKSGGNMRFAMGVALAVISSNALADWTLVGSTEGGADIYVDRATISKSTHIAKLWLLEDRKEAQTFSGKTFLSAKLQYEYDCKDNQRRVLQSSLYSGQKAGGSLVQSGSKPGPWRPIAAGRVSETMWKIACGKK
jgi:hypothetical protein